MPKKFGINSKAQEARAVETQKKNKIKAEDEERIESQKWVETDKNILKNQDKQVQQEAKRLEEQQRKQENKRLLEEEENQAINAKKPKGVKLTKTELNKQAKKEQMMRALRNETGVKQEEEGYNSEEEMQQMIELNVDEMLIEEQKEDNKNYEEGLNKAMDNLSMNEKHPEKRIKHLYRQYVEEQMGIVKEEQRGLKRSQYLQMIYKRWQKADSNPFNNPNRSSYNQKI